MIKNIISVILLFTLLLCNCFIVSANSMSLNVDYDDCAVSQLSDGEDEMYGSCEDEHSISGDNMLLVATDGIRDFYKCLCCRYIEEVDHVHSAGGWASNDHEAHDRLCAGCFQTVYTEEHSMEYAESSDGTYIIGTCSDCGFSHDFRYRALNATSHVLKCDDCGEIYGDAEGHLWATHTSNNIIKCSLCGFLKNTGGAITPVLPFKTDLPEEESE